MLALSTQRSRLRTPLTLVLVLAGILLVLHLWHLPTHDAEVIHVITRPAPGAPTQHHVPLPTKTPPAQAPAHLPELPSLPPDPEEDKQINLKTDVDECQALQGAEELFVVLKTGATELHHKLPIHFNTTLKCIPHYAIFSDMAEEVNGHQIHDALDTVSDEVSREAEEFTLYHKMREYHNMGKNISDVMRSPDDTKTAWNLDKWKFLPMMVKAYELRDDAKWYVFVEADTYILYSNLLMYLEHLRPEQDWYIGGQTWIDDDVFAHGGTGFVISNPAMKKLTAMLKAEKEEMEKMTLREWAGDLVLSKALKKVGISLTQTWPIFQGETPSTLDFTERHYCYPVVSYHHVNAEWVQFLWDFEQEWIKTNRESESQIPVRHRDAFTHFVEPSLRNNLTNWDNISKDTDTTVELDSPEACQEKCEAERECVQWRHLPGGLCKLGKVIRLGAKEPDESVRSTSGWMNDRIQKFMKKMEPCRQEWILH